MYGHPAFEPFRAAAAVDYLRRRRRARWLHKVRAALGFAALAALFFLV